MNITSTGVAVALAVVLALGLLFFGPNVLTLLFPQPQPATTEDGGLTVDTATTDQSAGTQQATQTTTQTNPTTMQPQSPTAPANLPTTLTVKDITVGSGAEAKSGDVLTMNYVGMLPDGSVFDASAKHGQAFSFTLGAHQVIAGWDQGLVGMKVGGKRQLIIPPDMGYGAQGAGGVIPPNATLIFEVELVKIGK